MRCDNGTELANHLTSALYDAFDVCALRGPARHPQNQGAAERFNRSLLTTPWASLVQLLLGFAAICLAEFRVSRLD